MAKLSSILIAFVSMGVFTTFSTNTFDADKIKDEQIQWTTFEKAIESIKKEPKLIFVDVYTDWAGWCKKMDKDTYQHPEVIAYMNKKFYCVKFDAEKKEDVLIMGRTYKFVPNGRRGYHELAAELLEGKMNYPAMVYINKNLDILSTIKGYRQPKEFLQISTYFGDDFYQNQTWNQYKSSYKD